MTESEVRSAAQQAAASLSAQFERVTRKMKRPALRNKEFPKGNDLYKAQVDFAYALNELMQGPACMIDTYVYECKKIISLVKADQQ